MATETGRKSPRERGQGVREREVSERGLSRERGESERKHERER